MNFKKYETDRKITFGNKNYFKTMETQELYKLRPFCHTDLKFGIKFSVIQYPSI